MKELINKKWILTTLLVTAAVGVMIRLGFWQLDRLDQRKAFIDHYLEQSFLAPLSLDVDIPSPDLGDMEYRQITVSGEYDHSKEVVIRNQSWKNQAGVHLLTPLMISGSKIAVLVDRGWIPLDVYQSGNWEKLDETGIISITGIIRNSQKPNIGGRPDPTPSPGKSIKAWNFINIDAIAQQIPYQILSIYIQQLPHESRAVLPHRALPEIDISEGPHLGYALQWFAFAAILAVGYPIYVHREIKLIKQS